MLFTFQSSSVCSTSKKMSSSPQKRPSSPQNRHPPLIGYVHDFSTVQRNRKDTLDFHTFTIQTSSSENRTGLLYSPKKKKLLLESQQSRTPVKLQDYTFTDDDKIIVNDMTYITSAQPTEYSFQYKNLPATMPDPVTLLDILNEKKEWELVTVRAKVLSTKEPTTVGAKNFRLCEGMIGDNTSTMPIDIWEQHIEKIKPGKTYSFKAIQLKVWNKVKKLSTTKKSEIDEITDDALASIEDDAATEDPPTAEVTVDEVLQLEKYAVFYKCFKCSRRINQNATSKTVKCNKCGIMRTDKCQTGISSKLSVNTTANGILSLNFRDDALQQLLPGDVVVNMDEETLAEKLLYLTSFKLMYETTTFNVISITTT